MKHRTQLLPKYHDIDSDDAYGGYLFDLVNRENLQSDGNWLLAKPAWPDGYGNLPRHPWRFPNYLEKPRVLLEGKPGRALADLRNQDGFWFVSRALKTLLEQMDPNACEFRECETVFASGDAGPEYWLCSVTRFFFGKDVIACEAIEGLTLRPAPNGFFDYVVYPQTKIRFKPEAIGSAHLFRVVELGRSIFCDQSVKDACRAAGIKGVRFDKMGA